MAKQTSRIPSPQTQFSEGTTITDIDIPDDIKPEISITYLEISTGEYSLKGFYKISKKNPDVYKDLSDFMVRARKYKNIQELLDNHCPKNGLKAKDKTSQQKMKEIKKLYNVDTSDMCHIHLKPNGKGAFVLHGFILHNCFEVVWLDPEHKIHK